MKGAPIRAAIGLLAAAFVAGVATAGAAVPHPGLAYDLDGSPAPVPAGLAQVDLYQPDDAGPGDDRPVVVYVHGGSWRTGDKDNKIGDKVRLFTGAGYIFASVNYRLSPDPVDPAFPAGRVRFPDHPDDIGEAIGWIDRNVAGYGGDPDRILLIGHSAGAHLVSLVTTDPRYVRRWDVDRRHLLGTVSLDTDAYDVARRVAGGTARAKAMIFNAFATPAENAVDGTWAQASPLTWADGEDPPMLLVTESRAPGRVAGSEAMASALGSGRGDVLAVPYDHEGINSAVGSSDDPAGETAAIMGFFENAVAASTTSKVKIRRRPPQRVRIRDGHRTEVRFGFAAKTAAAGFECRLDEAKFLRCSSPAAYRVGRGRHRFRVRAIASSGDRGPVHSARFRVVRWRARRGG